MTIATTPVVGRPVADDPLRAEFEQLREIAVQLVVSVATVERHIANLYAKIGARGRADATAFALRNGLMPDGGR